MTQDEYRLIQDGLEVVSVSGPPDEAFCEIFHYAMIYSQDGPVQIQKQVSGGWWPVELREPA